MSTHIVDLRQAFRAQAIEPQTMTATVTGTGFAVDSTNLPTNYDISIGTVSGGTPSLVVKVQESSVLGSGYTDISGQATAAITAAGNAQLCVINGTLQYQRVVATQTGAGNIPISVVVLGQKRVGGTGSGSSVSPQT